MGCCKVDSSIYGNKMAKQMPNAISDVKDIPCEKVFIYDKGNGYKTAFLLFPDGFAIYDYSSSEEAYPWHKAFWHLSLAREGNREFCGRTLR